MKSKLLSRLTILAALTIAYSIGFAAKDPKDTKPAAAVPNKKAQLIVDQRSELGRR